MREYFLDARAMEHPEPLKASIDILKKLDSSSYLYMLHRKEPVPLLALAGEHKLNSLSILAEDGHWHILITPNQECNLKEYLRLFNPATKE